MTREYIMTHTPAQIAAENSADDIRQELECLPFTLDEAADLYGNNDPTERANENILDIDFCENLLVEWYDEQEENRPCNSEELAMAFQLYAAWYIRTSNE